MKALYFVPGKRPEEIDMEDMERVLKGRADYLYPFLDDNICVAARLFREEMPQTAVLLDEDGYELDELTGPLVIFREDGEDLSEENMDFIEMHIRCYEGGEPFDGDFPSDDEDPENEGFNPTRIVDTETFEDMLRNERTEEQKYF